MSNTIISVTMKVSIKARCDFEKLSDFSSRQKVGIASDDIMYHILVN